MWVKKGLLLNINNHKHDGISSHASIPFALNIDGDLFRIFFSSRNAKGKSFPYFVDAIISSGTIKIQNNISHPLMQLGDLGTFDDSGIMPSSIVQHEDTLYMFYIGWNPQVTVSYRLSIGLAISDDFGLTFNRVSNGPICDRSFEEPFFNTAPFVVLENNIWKMWYISCTGWEIINKQPEPKYHVKYTESTDGVHWKKKGVISIDYDEKAKAIGRPCIVKNNDVYEMYFSYRDILDYRTQKGKGYQLGKAISVDGINWEKKYDDTGIELSEDGWDSMMMEYCHVFNHDGIDYMLYNGNGFGEDGFGFAIRR